MSTATTDPATPVKVDDFQYFGLSAREYAAIKLRVPDSGTEWLDAMIRKSMRDDFAAKALQGLCATGKHHFEVVSRTAYDMADIMLEARDA